MAIISNEHLSRLRQGAAGRTNVNYTKTTINAAFQAIEDTFENSRGAFNAAINNATSPFVFSPAQKKILVALWAQQKFEREEV